MDYSIPDFICDGIYLGKSNSALHLPTLQTLNITHILMVGYDLIAHYPDFFTYKHIIIDDKATEKDIMLQSFNTTNAFIDAAIATGGNVLIHCHAGVSRSPSVVIAWLMHAYNMTYPAAYAFVKQWRPIIQPNKGFKAVLESLSQDTLGQHINNQQPTKPTVGI